MNKSLAIYIAVTTTFLGAVAYYYQTAPSRNEPSLPQAISFLQQLLEQETTAYGRNARIDLVGPDGEAAEASPTIFVSIEALGCPMTDQEGQYIRRAGRFFRSDYTCLYTAEAPEGVLFHLAAYVSRDNDPTLRYRLNGYGFRLLPAQDTIAAMERFDIHVAAYSPEAQRELWDQLARLGIYVPADTTQTSPFELFLQNQ